MRKAHPLSRFLTAFPLAFRRLRHHAGLSMSSAVGILSILCLAVCVPVFTNAMLRQSLVDQLAQKAAETGRGLFALHAVYPDNLYYTPLTVENAQVISQHIKNVLERSMGLEVEDLVLQVTSDLMVFEPVQFKSTQPVFQQISLYLMANDLVPEKVRLVEGTWPQATPASEPVQVAIQEAYADDRFLNVGDIYASRDVNVEVVGIFHALDPQDPFWFYNPDQTFQNILWVPLETFRERLPEIQERPLHTTYWYALTADDSLRFQNSLNYTHEMVRLDASLREMLPGVRIDYSPIDQFRVYEERLGESIALFYAAGAPVLVLALLFTGLIASISARQYEQENAVLCARGGSGGQVLGMNLAESLLLVLLVLPLALCLGWLAAVLMGQTDLFLRFTSRSQISFSLRDVDLFWLGVAIGVVILARLIPLLGRLRPSILALKQERSRVMKKPFWERFYLDIGLLVPGGYALWVMRQRVIPEKLLEGGRSGQYDPLMFLASSIVSIALCLFLLRVFPWILRLLSRIVERLHPPWPYLAVQEVTRHPHAHASVMLLIMISLSFSIFTASMAKTLDGWVNDSENYRAGADLVVKEYVMPIGLDPVASAQAIGQQGQPGLMNNVESLVSLQRHLRLPGILNATYVGKYPGKISYGGFWYDSQIMGIDRLTFPKTAYFRPDFAADSLGALMNSLAVQPSGILLLESLAEEIGLRPGDHLRLQATVGLDQQTFSGDMVVAGVYRYFPTIYPGESPTVIVNLDTLFGIPESITGYEVWLNLEEEAQVSEIVEGLSRLALEDIQLVEVQRNALEAIQNARSRSEWVGLFGIFNVGFLLTALLPGIGFVLYTFSVLRGRSIQFGILQAIGLSRTQLAWALVLEQSLLMALALAGGALVGLVISVLFVPILQIGAAGTAVPPFDVRIGWSEALWLCLAFGVVFLATLAGTLVSLVRLQIFAVVKMGEAI